MGKSSDAATRLTALLASGNPAEKELALRDGLPDLIARDAAAAARLAQDLQPWASREEALFLIAREWAAKDASAAAAWASGLPDAAEREAVFRQVCIAIASTDPARALDLAGGDPVLREQLVQLLTARDPDAAIRWAARHTDAVVRESAFASIAVRHAEVSPEAAARLVAEHLSPGPAQDEAALAVLHQWILRDPSSARGWVDIFPEGPLLDLAEEELASAAAYPVRE